MQTTPPVVDYSKKWLVLSAVSMGIFLATIDGSIVNISLPTLVHAFKTDFALVQWVVLSYLLTVTTLVLGVGRLADIYGKKRIYTAGFIVFTLGSVLCGFSPTIQALIGFRVVQAVGASMIMALGMAIVTEAFPGSERGRALGITGTIVSVGIALGPTLGGFIIQNISWRWIFFVNFPIGVLGTWMVTRYVPNFQPAGRQRFDYWGALTLCVTLLSFLIGLTTGQRIGFGELPVIFLLVNALIFLGIFIKLELRLDEPMLDLRLFKNSLFSVSLTTGFIVFVCLSGSILLIPFYAENVLGFNPQQTGMLMAIVPIALGISAPISGILSDRYGTRPITVAGLAMLTVGFILVSGLNAETTALGYVLRFLPVGIGMGMFQSPNNSAIMGAAPRSRLGIASGMLSVTRTLGQTTGIAILGALWAGQVFKHVGNLLPGGATTAPIAAQVAGLQTTFLLVSVLIFLALLLSIWGMREEGKQKA
ncbi:MAG: MFS transporter [Anaerolineae bacterium]|jgi:EmrB/QacA subfamily drug resistance transporter|nr:MFS transporter [Anaerolineae bacterium]MBT7070692.1 MFS transporter [Anaerolineae bacterium]MBT7323890.1 MFS transporter [Anaerolineae bacterium]